MRLRIAYYIKFLYRAIIFEKEPTHASLTRFIMSVQYTERCSIHQGDNMGTASMIMSTQANIMSTPGDSLSTLEGTQYKWGIS